MKKMFLVLTTAGLCAVSTVALSSDKALASAWTGVSGSLVKFVKSANLRASATPVPAMLAGSTEASAAQGESRTRKAFFVLPDFGAKQADGGACPWCPEPPCQ